MTNRYYFDNNEQKQEPITLAQLKTLAADGLITPTTIIFTEEGEETLAGRVNGLEFSQQSAYPVEQQIPLSPVKSDPPQKLYTPETIEKQIDAVSVEHANWQLQNEEKQAIKDFLLRLQKITGEDIGHSDLQSLLGALKGHPRKNDKNYKINLWGLNGMSFLENIESNIGGNQEIEEEIRKIIEKAVHEFENNNRENNNDNNNNIDIYIVNCVWLDRLIGHFNDDVFSHNNRIIKNRELYAKEKLKDHFSLVAEQQLTISLGGEIQSSDYRRFNKRDKNKYDRIKTVESMLPESNRLTGNAHDTIEQLRQRALKIYEDKIKFSIERKKQEKAAKELF
ncbi:MAG: DUF4339 domain-containing protein [Planctomycetaceae bacterium]|jgi:hypothetical protein|nr:DUF4339 domain-containing protein [Planctomycetaceae bacterium]